MTSNANPAPPPRSPLVWAGLLLPGLGHLFNGQGVDGIGISGISLLVYWSVIGGHQRILDRLHAPGTPDFAIHPWIAVVALLGYVIVLWGRAWRQIHPLPRDPERDRTSQLRIISRQFARNRMGVLGGYLVLWMVTLAVLTPMIAPYDPDLLDVGPQLGPPSFAHLMGTDDFRRDLFSRVLYGSRISLSIGFIAVSIAGTIGTLLGATAGYFGGWYDRIVMWFTDLLLSLPRLVLLLAIVGFFRAAGAQSLFLIVFILGLTGWMGVSRIVRSQVLSLKEQDFIQATRALGLPASRIILRHLIPNAAAPVIVYTTLGIGGTILVEASLSFLGLGVPPPTATWGSLVNDGREFLRAAWWYTLFPGLMIVFAVMSFNLLGDGLRDALDPKLRGRG